ncbi:hypothetical protein [Pseudooceanicola algae]|uniref:Uncharacterized protein n=1 Tax=Pseudooceanicola algae TaxID=1537215 RepID=A0A418SJJ0_9RHOB|nr:hypothetical protein [Pseudooceanicola algae]QPM91904.1 hypothetical protein PSAL_031660 [Pseudooceanicola algae]
MTRSRWHRLEQQDGTVTVTRRLPVRFDLRVETCLAAPDPLSRTALAHQIRQDLWRALRDLPGLSPAVTLRRTGGVIEITAGGRLERGRVSERDRNRCLAVLEDPARQARWLAHAGRRCDG